MRHQLSKALLWADQFAIQALASSPVAERSSQAVVGTRRERPSRNEYGVVPTER